MPFLPAPFFPTRGGRSGSPAARLKRLPLAGAFMLATVMFAATVPNAEAYYDVTIGTTNTAGAWVGSEWIPSGTGSTVAAREIETLLASGPVTITPAPTLTAARRRAISTSTPRRAGTPTP